MPDPYERHSRPSSIYDAYDFQPSRSAQRQMAAEEPAAKRPPGKKDRALCKAAHWKMPHKRTLRLQEYGWRRTYVCKWAISWRKPGEPSWHCAHEEVCSGCGKILRMSISDEECPAYHPVTAGEIAAIEAERAEHEARIAATRVRSRWQPRPPITGPQGYRRTRPS